MKYETGICANCGATHALHQSETEVCPRFGIEETREGHKQEWEDRFEYVFVDSGLKRLSDAAPELLEALELAKEELIFLFAQKQNNKFWSEESEIRFAKISSAITKAKG